jgi:hypothetical protein
MAYRKMPLVAGWLVATLVLGVYSPVSRAADDTGPSVTFDHLAQGATPTSQTIELKPGQAFTVLLTNTCKSEFKLSVAGVQSSNAQSADAEKAKKSSQAARYTEFIQQAKQSRDEAKATIGKLTYQMHSLSESPPSTTSEIELQEILPEQDRPQRIVPNPTRDQLLQLAHKGLSDAQSQLSDANAAIETYTQKRDAAQAVNCGTPPNDTLSTTVVHQSGNVAYEVAISRTGTDAGPVSWGGQNNDKYTLSPATDVLVVESSPWSTIFSGGITVSKLTNPKFALQPTTSGAATYTVVRGASPDAWNPGLALFITETNQSWSFGGGPSKVHFGITFGLGTNTGTRVEYYPGVSLIFDKLLLTVGANIGTVDALPSGPQLGSTTSNANALSSLSSRTGVGFFFGLSWTLFGSNAQTQLQNAIVPATH